MTPWLKNRVWLSEEIEPQNRQDGQWICLRFIMVDSAAAIDTIDPWLCSQKFFHGYLAREELPSLLMIHGDFLIRCNEVEAGQPKELVVSVLNDPDGKYRTLSYENKLEATRNIIIQSAIANKEKKYFVDSREKFPSVEQLIKYYKNNPIIINQTELRLTRAIRLAKWEYPSTSIQVGDSITSRASVEIKQGKLTKYNGTVVDVAIKMIKNKSDISKQQVRDMVKEARLLRNLDHPNIIRFYGVCLLEQPIYILFELLAEGPLDVYLAKNKEKISGTERLEMVMNIAWGLEYLHSREILHRDIATKNCFYSDAKIVKISEFTLCRQGVSYSMKTARKMDIKRMAPESIKTFVFTQKSDVYTYGIFIYEVFSSTEPYEKLNVIAARNSILNGTLNEFPDSTPKQLVEYVKKNMWDTNPEKRLDMQEVCHSIEFR
ncbi:SH2 domain protein [Dictyocaulus viviparus]|uniref:Tyrosine-protein kinase n=1 Tax=Dictyocaulus viviparus TaxID=29172 RepID=A0A0D8XNZ0_DICVI|nr:SH2 domain protein [Dictyocaulus viviparus]